MKNVKTNHKLFSLPIEKSDTQIKCKHEFAGLTQLDDGAIANVCLDCDLEWVLNEEQEKDFRKNFLEES
jgi:hypothetical protein